MSTYTDDIDKTLEAKKRAREKYEGILQQTEQRQPITATVRKARANALENAREKYGKLASAFIVPSHLRNFWRLYNKLLKDGWFDRMQIIFTKNESKMPVMVCEYGIKLIRLLKAERNIARKHEYFIALEKLTDYIAGELGRL